MPRSTNCHFNGRAAAPQKKLIRHIIIGFASCFSSRTHLPRHCFDTPHKKTTAKTAAFLTESHHYLRGVFKIWPNFLNSAPESRELAAAIKRT
jgi:hypothetical protein